jgi:membrane fusion protein (multidrug efflux system)
MNLVKLLPIAILASLVFVSCKGKTPEPAAAASESVISVVADTLQPQPFEEWVSYPADLRGSQDATLGAGMGGRVLDVAEVGTWVKEGDALCNIETERYSAVVAQADAAMELTKGELDRADANVKAGSLGKASLDNARLAHEGAKVSRLQSQRAFEDSRCQAPFNGVIVSRSIEKFQTVAPGMPTVRLARTDRLEAWISLPESDLSTYKRGTPVRLTVPGIRAEEFVGTLKSVDLAVDTRTRTALARLEIVNRKNQLGPGMAGKALLLRKSYPAALVIPTTAILRNEEGPFVMVAEKGIAHKRTIDLGPAVGDSVVVNSGIKSGEVLIVVGSFRASEGTRIKY